MKWINAVGKIVLIDILNSGLLETYDLFKKKKYIPQSP